MGFRAAAFEAVRRGEERLIEHSLAHAAQLLGLAVVNVVRRHVTDARVPARSVVPPAATQSAPLMATQTATRPGVT